MDTALEDLQIVADIHNVTVRGVVSSSDGQSAVLMSIEHDGDSFTFFSTGYLSDKQQAIDFAYGLMQETTEDLMNLLKNDKLFPNIRGVMLKDKPVTLTLSGRVNITELQGGDSRVELFFSDHKKTAVVNRNQALNIIEVYGPETDDWAGKPVVLYAEEGVWFGKHQWGIRIDPKATARAAKTKKPPHAAAVETALRMVDKEEADAKAEPLFDLEENGAYIE